jgi:hypothetical protein
MLVGRVVDDELGDDAQPASVRSRRKTLKSSSVPESGWTFS